MGPASCTGHATESLQSSESLESASDYLGFARTAMSLLRGQLHPYSDICNMFSVLHVHRLEARARPYPRSESYGCHQH